MTSREEDSSPLGASGRPPALHERVAQLYYSHGLFCSSYPTTVIAIALSVALLCCYPLVNLPLPGNLPLQVWGTGPNASTSGLSTDMPWCYVQQVVLRTAVMPWDPGLSLGDAFRAPLYEAFKLLDIVRNYQDPQSFKTLGHVCLHVEAVKMSKNGKNNVLPQYSCLVLSPANMWHQDVQEFAQDASLLTTVFNHQGIQKGKVSMAEMLFGMHLTDTGIKRYPLRNRQRIVQFAVTLYLKEYDEQFISGLRQKLHVLYPLHQNTNTVNFLNDTIHIHYPGEFNFLEFIPITLSFFILFVYYYFSVRKIELIKSKLGMAFTAVVTVLGSLSMSLGLCFFFGLTLSLQGKEIYPYLVILVGLENVLVLTKSVVSTPPHLDVKIRVAQGLSKEGWSITKNLFIELTILTVGLFTFVPAIQEFCIFAIVGLLTDFFLQMLFFSTILGIDTRRLENLVEKSNINFRNSLYQNQVYYDKSYNTFSYKSGMIRSKSHPRLTSFHTNVVAGQTHNAQEKKIPKRLRLVNIWARTRFFQRAFMILMVIWIGIIVYSTGVVEHYFLDSSDNFTKNFLSNNSNIMLKYNSSLLLSKSNQSYIGVNYVTQKSIDVYEHNQTDDFNKLKHSDYVPWLRLSTQHWSAILRKYNFSLGGRYIAVLPNIRISRVINPEQAILLRNPEEKYGRRFQWQALAAALDPIEFKNLDDKSGSANLLHSEQPYYPTSPMEILLTTILCTISVIVLSYGFVVLYRCICSRNYAEWRASWFNEKAEESDIPVLLEAVPIVLEGHQQEIECLASDGFSIVSSCLGGQIKVWDATTGESLSNINRKLYFMSPIKSPVICIDNDDGNPSDYESGSPPSRDENIPPFPSLQHKINTNFTNSKLEPVSNTSNGKYDFGAEYRQLYLSHGRELKHRHAKNTDTAKWVQHQRQIRTSGCELQCNGGGDVGENRTSESCEKLKRGKSDVRSEKSVCRDVCVGERVNNGGGVIAPPIWCMDYLDNLIVIGCANGRLEFWEGTTGKFKCIFDDGSGVGVTSVKIVGSRVIAARLYGTLDFLQLQTYSQGMPIDWNFTCAYRRTHIRTGSAGSISDYADIIKNDSVEDLRCLKVFSTRAHQQPITCLDSEGGRVVSGSQDHTLRVFRLEDGSPLYTLHGHCGPITCLFIDRVCPATSGSGSQDGMLCVWDLLTGACMYSIQAHYGSITSLTYSASYVISFGSDERLCVWERFQGHLLNTVHISHAFANNVVMLTPHLVVSARTCGLTIWDVRSGDNIRNIAFGHSPYIFVKQMLMLRDSILCDFGNQLRIVRFPLITHKFD